MIMLKYKKKMRFQHSWQMVLYEIPDFPLVKKGSREIAVTWILLINGSRETAVLVGPSLKTGTRER